MLSAGVNAQCPPFVKAEQLSLIMSVVESGEIWGGKEFIQSLIAQSAKNIPEEHWEQDELGSLSERENAVALLVSRGSSNKVIATQMNITERTVKAHLTAIYKKLAVKDRLALALLVQQHIKSHGSADETQSPDQLMAH
ncbi:response regulator transcription factor [Marinomonas ostreistagni]|nr:response regulator transcription factor [Marinomonas ostreistagni]